MADASRGSRGPPQWVETSSGRAVWPRDLELYLAQYISRKTILTRWINDMASVFDNKVTHDPNTGEKLPNRRAPNSMVAERRQQFDDFIRACGGPSCDKIEAKCRNMREKYDTHVATVSEWARAVPTHLWTQNPSDQAQFLNIERKEGTWFRTWHDYIALAGRYSDGTLPPPPPRTPTEPQRAFSGAGSSSYGGGPPGVRNAFISRSHRSRPPTPERTASPERAGSLFSGGSDDGAENNSAFVHRSGGAKRQRTNSRVVPSSPSASDSEDEPLVFKATKKGIDLVNSRLSKSNAQPGASTSGAAAPRAAPRTSTGSSSGLDKLRDAAKFNAPAEPKRTIKRAPKLAPASERPPPPPPIKTQLGPPALALTATPLGRARAPSFSVPNSASRITPVLATYHKAGSSSGSGSIGKETNPTTAHSPSLPDLDAEHQHQHAPQHAAAAPPLTMGAALDTEAWERRHESLLRLVTALEAQLTRQSEEHKERDERHLRERAIDLAARDAQARQLEAIASQNTEMHRQYEELQRRHDESQRRNDESQRLYTEVRDELSELKRERKQEMDMVKRIEEKQDLLGMQVDRLHGHMLEHL